MKKSKIKKWVKSQFGRNTGDILTENDFQVQFVNTMAVIRVGSQEIGIDFFYDSQDYMTEAIMQVAGMMGYEF